MASGLPVVTTDDPVYRGSSIAHGITLSRRDAVSFRGAITRILSDPEC